MKELIEHLAEHMSHIVNKVTIVVVVVLVIICAFWLWSGGFKQTFMPPPPTSL